MPNLRVSPSAPEQHPSRSRGLRYLFALLLISLFSPCYSTLGQVRVNEVMSSNGESLRDENCDSPDWLELHNAGSEPVNLEGFGLSDNPSRPFKWLFGKTTIPAGGYLVVFASGKDRHPLPALPMNPSDIPGLRSLLDASRISVSDNTQVRASGDFTFVRQWIDATGNGNAASQDSDASQPVLIDDFKGFPAVRFDGANDILHFPNHLATNSFSILAVYRTSQPNEIDPEGNGGVGGVSGQHYLFGAEHGGDFHAGAGISVGDNGVSVYEHGSSYMPALAVYQGEFAAGPTVLGLFYNERRPDLELWSIPLRNGVISARSQVTAPVEIGGGAYGSFSGDVAEILLYDRSLTSEERRGVAGYFMAKYGIDSAAPHHTNFEISSDGEEIILTRPDGTIEDQLTFLTIPRDVSFGRDPADTATTFFYAEPTPGGPNNTPGTSEFLAAPEFSHAAGFYNQAVTLIISNQNAGAELRYTLDGSEPTPASQLYSGPITLGRRNGTPNDISMIPTVPGGATPDGEVYKGWVVRARAFKASAMPSAVATRSYFIDPRGRSRYSVPVISLSTHRDNFFDNQIGIYVPGNAPGGNYSQKSDEWQRPVYVEFIETNNLVAFSQEADVKIHGNTSQNFPIKGLDLDGTGGRGRQSFTYRIFPDRNRTEFEHFLLRPSGHDHHMAFMRDEMMQSLGRETGAESQAARPCVVFINGEYWGLHYLKEKEDTEFASYYGNVPMDAVDFLEGYATAKAGDISAYQSLIQQIATEDLRLPGVYAEIGQRMDLANYIDYKVTENFFYRWDMGNHRFWRPRNPEGRFRWLQFDNDVGWGGFWSESPAWSFNMLEAVLTPSGSLHGHNNETTVFLLSRLLANPTFRTDFINRFADLLNTLFLPAYTTARINAMAAPLIPEMTEHTRRWRAPGSLTEWRSHVEYLRTYATNRPPAMRQHLMNRFNLDGTAQVNVSVNHPAGGTLQLNTLTLTSPTNAPWTGTYFRRNPITLTAHAKPGFHFAGWTGLLGIGTNRVTLLLNGDLTLTANFEPDAAPTINLVERAGNAIYGVAQASAGVSYRVEFSRDLEEWTTINVVTCGPDGMVQFQQTISSGRAFYRLRSVEP